MLAPSVRAAVLPEHAGSTASRVKAGAWLRHSKSVIVHPLVLFMLASFVGCVRAPVTPAPEAGFSSSDRLVGTYYFYWYKYPDVHFFDRADRTDDALTDHFRRPERVDYESVDWHAAEFSHMASCDIDFALPVYWGGPGISEKGFSDRGLETMQAARDHLVECGKPCPRIGMFYDTSTLLNSLRNDTPRGGKADLRTPHGKDVFYGTIRGYWKRLDRKHWAAIDGRPLTVLYSAGFAAGFDQSTFDYVYEQFEKDFGVRPYIIGEASWRPAKMDGYYRWGAALWGPYLDDVAEIGPGYDDRAVPGRSTPIRVREDGRFYEHGWVEAIRSGCRIVLIETWNEMHEGTDVCESKEYGRTYMDLTRKYARCFKKTIDLRYRFPLPRGPSEEGKEFAEAREVLVDFNKKESKGLRAVPHEDGRFEVVEAAGRRCLESRPGPSAYLYFAVPDPFYFGERQPVEIEVDYLDSGTGGVQLQYDSFNDNSTFAGAYTNGGTIERTGSDEWKAHVFRLNDAAFFSRQNSKADFRLAVLGESIHVSRVVVRKVGKGK